jgi:type IV pilus assembly protein PilY1
VDVDLDGDTDLVYVADLQGHLWRFETGGGMDPGSWSRTELFSGDQPIMAAPTPAFGPNNHVYVYFGTGVYIEDDDMMLADDNSFYCVFDTHDGATRTRGDLVDQTDGDEDIGTAEGWYLDLWHADGERVIEQAAVVAEKVFFTSFVPGMEPCTAGGQSWMYRVAYDDGALPEDPEGEDDGYDTRDVDLGDGVASRPVVDIVNESVIIQSSDASIDIEEIGGTYFHLNVRAWQENYDFVDETPSYPDVQ